MKLKLLIDGGEMKPGPVVSQKLGPLGVNIGKIISDVNEKTAGFKGMKVPVEIEINNDKSYEIKVFSPPTSQLIKKELGIEKASGEQNKIQAGNLAIEQVISVAKTKFPDMLANDFKAAVKSVVGTCVSLGVLIENKAPKSILKDIEKGKFDKEIQEQKTDVDPEKIKNLQEFFEKVKTKQEKILREEEEAAAKEEAEAAEKGEAVEGGEAAEGDTAEKKTPSNDNKAKKDNSEL